LDLPGKEDEVRRRFGSWARPIAGLVALTLGLAVAAPSVAAEVKQPVAQKQSLTASAKAKVAALALPGAAQTRAQATATPSAPATASKGFFSTGAGRAALVLMAAGTGFMVYSAFHDNNPVHSQFR
jgi:hypothetical protein